MTVQTTRPWESVSGKVTAQHRDRLAVVYVRQSTLRQVTHHTESTKLQYALVERASMLGWGPSRVRVIDEHMGHSAGAGQDRVGCQCSAERVTWCSAARPGRRAR